MVDLASNSQERAFKNKNKGHNGNFIHTKLNLDVYSIYVQSF